jgi:poly-beta-hydroxyalkanoate depolymerase
MGSIVSFLFDFDIEPDSSQTTIPLFPPSASNSLIGKPNLETFSLLWCDADVEKVYSSRATHEKLLDLISFQRTFTSSDECEQYIRQQTTSADKIILICSGSFAQLLLSGVHALPQLTSVYIYCFHKGNYQQLHGQFAKVSDQKRD